VSAGAVATADATATAAAAAAPLLLTLLVLLLAMFAGPGGLAGKMAAKGRAAKASMASEKEGENAFVLAVRTLYVYGSR